jgi:hypothetical protein
MTSGHGRSLDLRPFERNLAAASTPQSPVRAGTAKAIARSGRNGRARHKTGGGDRQQDQAQDREYHQHAVADLPARIAWRRPSDTSLRAAFGSIGHRLS